MLINKLKKINLKDNIDELSLCDVILFCHDNDYNLTLRNKAYSALLDSVREDIERRKWKTQTVNHPFSRIQSGSAYSNPILINKSYILARLKDTISKFFLKKENHFTIELYANILEKCNPKCIILIGAPSALCLAAYYKKIPCIELLHGIGYTKIMWDYDKRKIEELPTGILSFDDRSTRTFKNLSATEILQIPHPFLKRLKKNLNKDDIPEEWKGNYETDKFNKLILISLQWGYDGTYKELEGIIKNHVVLNELLSIIEFSYGKNILWAFRLHPVQLRDKRYKSHLDFVQIFCEQHSNAQWQWSTEMPLPVVLQQCTGHITMSSMSSYEAAYMGIKTLALCPTLRTGGYSQNMFSDLEEAGYLTKAQADTQNIIDWVEAVQPTQPFLDNLADEEAWENAVEWMLGSRYKNDEKEA